MKWRERENISLKKEWKCNCQMMWSSQREEKKRNLTLSEKKRCGILLLFSLSLLTNITNDQHLLDHSLFLLLSFLSLSLSLLASSSSSSIRIKNKPKNLFSSLSLILTRRFLSQKTKTILSFLLIGREKKKTKKKDQMIN